MDEAELAFVATMRDEASAVAKQARRTIDSTTGTTKPVEVPLKIKDELSTRLKSASASLDAFGDKAVARGKSMTRNLTLPILGVGAAIGKTSIDFSRGMGDVASLLPGNTTRVRELREEVLKLGPETGSSLDSLSRGLYQTLSAFGDTADTALILEQNAKAARAGAAEVADAINLTSAVTKAYGDTSAKAVGKAADLALMTVRMGQTTFPELAGSVGMVTPLTNELRVSQEELFATMASLTGVTGGASEVSTQLRGALQSLMAPTADTTKALKDHGYESGKALVEDKGLAGALEFLTDAAEKSGKPLQAYISSIEGQVAALALAGPQADKYRDSLKAMEGAAGTTKEAFDASTSGVGEAAFTWDQAKAEASAMAVQLGDGLAPALRDLLVASRPIVTWIGEMATKFANADPETQKLVATVLALTAAIGPLLVVLGSMARGASSIVSFAGTVVGGLERMRASFRQTGIEAEVASTKVSRMGGLARGAAGAAGLGALAVGASTSNDALGLLSNVGGGAMLGFAVGGPIGAAIGGGAGALLSLATAGDDAGESLAAAKPPAADFAASLDRVSGAATTATREIAYMSLQGTDAAKSAGALGISQRELVDAIVGTGTQGKAAQAKIDGLYSSLMGVGDQAAPFERGTPEWVEWRNNIHNVRNEVGDLTGNLSKSQAETRALYQATAPLKQLYRGLPPEAITRIEAKGAPESIKQVARLSARYNLTPKQVRTVLQATGVAGTVKQVQRVRGELEKTSATKGDLKNYSRGVEAGAKAAQGAAKRGGGDVRKGLENEVKGTKANLNQYKTSVSSGASSAAGAARSGGHQVGSELKAGIISGFAGTQALLASQAAAAVRAAVGAARAAARSHSPSLEFYDVGRDMGMGQVIGHRSTIPAMTRAARDAVRAVLGITIGDLTAGEDRVGNVLDSIGARIEKSYTTRLRSAARRKLAQADTKAEKARAKKLLESVDDRSAKATRIALKGLRDETAAIRANAAARAALGKRLEDAIQKGKDFAQTLKDYGSVTNVSTVNDAPITAGFIEQDLAKRLAAVRAFRDNLQRLRDRKADASIIADLEARGVEAGGATAAALAAATDAQLATINAQTKDIAAAANQAGTQSVAGLVAGIKSELAQAVRIGNTLGRALLRALRKALGIHSPAKETFSDGRNTVKGMTGGILAELPRAEHAAELLASRVQAAATPSLGDLSAIANATALRTLAVQGATVVTIRHEITSPDGSVDDLTAAQIAAMIASDPRSTRTLEAALSGQRGISTSHQITASDNR